MQNPVIKFSPKAKPLKIGGKEFQPIMQFNLSNEQKEKARIELGETDEKRKLCLAKLKELLIKDTKLNSRLDDDFLLCFLRVRKFSVSRAHKAIEQYYRLRKDNPCFYNTPNISEQALQNLYFKVLPFKDSEGRVAFLSRTGQWDVKEIPFENMMSLLLYMGDVIMSNPAIQVNGAVLIIDSENISWNQMWQFICPNNFQATVSLLQGCYPWRNKKTIFFNANHFVRAAMSMIMPFLRKKIKDRVLFLGNNLKDLHEHVSPEILPRDIGGALDERHFQPLHQFLVDNKEYVERCRKYGYRNS